MSRPAAGADPGGPLVALCVGHRCAALRRLAGTTDGTTDGVADVGEAVRRTPGAVLVTVACLGGCDRATLAGVAHRAPGTGDIGSTIWLSEVQTPERTDGLIAWLDAGGSGGADVGPARPPFGSLPGCLRTAVIGIGPPVRMSPLR